MSRLIAAATRIILAAWMMLHAAAGQALPGTNDYFSILVVDEETGRGVPLVELKTVNHVSYYTDSAGLTAFYEPALMGQTAFFHIKSHGYEFPKGRFRQSGQGHQGQPGRER